MIPDSGPEFQFAGHVDHGTRPASSFRVRRFLRFLLKYWWIPLLTLAAGIGMEAAYVYWKLPTFVCKSSMWETLKVKLPEGELFSEDAQTAVLGTQTELMQSEILRNQALELMRADPNKASSIPLGKDGKPQPPPVAIRVTGNAAKSSVFFIEASSPSPLFTQNYLDALMQAYLNYKNSVRKDISGETLTSVSEQMQKWEQDLKIAQEALSAFERTNNLAILEKEGSTEGEYLTKLKTQLSDLQLEARLLNPTASETNQAQAEGTNAVESQPGVASASADDLNPSPGASLDQQSNSREVELLKMQRQKLSKYLRPKHPKMVKLDEDIARAEKLQEIFLRQNRDQLAASRQANALRIANVVGAIKQWEAEVIEVNNLIGQAEGLKLNVQRIQSVYDRLAVLVQNLGISRNIDQESLAILDPASPVKRSYTSEKNGLTLSILGGLGAGLAIVYLISMRDDRLTSVIEVNAALGDAVVGMLPKVTLESGGETALLEFNDPRHIYAESYRSLRSALLFLVNEGERPKVLLITSAMPGEGKSTVAVNLARTLAFCGSRVLLVDADLRRGRLHHSLHMESKPGLAELLQQNLDTQQVMQTNSLPNFHFISRGSGSGNPGDLFLGSSLDQLLARWRQEFDYVVIDSSPLFAADDASCLAPKVDGTLVVVRSHHSSARVVREALDQLAQRQARVIGVIFNGIDASARSYPYYKYGDYSHSPSPV